MADLYNLYVRISTDTSGLESGLDEAVNMGEKATDKIGAATVAFGSLMADVVKKAASTLIDVAKSGIQYNAQIEQYTTSLTTALGSAEEAASAIEAIKKDAAATPFSVDGLVKANSYLISAGANAADARKTIMALSDAVSASGGGNEELQRMAQNLQQIKNVGKATSMDIRQFAMAGIDVYGILADYTGKSTAEVQDMEISYEMLTGALENAASEGGRFFEANLAQSRTLNGQISTLQDNIQSKLGEAFAGLTSRIQSDVLPAVNDFVQNLDVGAVVSGMETLVGVIGTIGAAIAAQKTADFIKTTFVTPIMEAEMGLVRYSMANGAAATSQALLSGEMGITGTIAGVLTGKITLAEAAQVGLNAAMAAFPYAIVAAGIIALGAVIVKGVKNFDTYVEEMSSVGDTSEEVKAQIDSLRAKIEEAAEADKMYGTYTDMDAEKIALKNLEERYVELTAAEEAAAIAAEDAANAEAEGSVVREASEEELAELAAAYAATYDKISQKVSGFFDTFEKAPQIQKASIDQMIANMQSQVAFNEQYADSIETINNSGIEGMQELVQTFADAGPEGANYAKAIADAIEAGDYEKVEQLANSWTEVQGSQERLTGTIAETTNAFKNLATSANNDISSIQKALNSIDGRHIKIYYDGEMSGTHPSGVGFATGLSYVPFDDFPATLHKGERVLTAAENREYTQHGGAGSSGITIVQNISSTPQTPVQLAAATAAYFEQARWAI